MTVESNFVQNQRIEAEADLEVLKKTDTRQGQARILKETRRRESIKERNQGIDLTVLTVLLRELRAERRNQRGLGQTLPVAHLLQLRHHQLTQLN